MAFGNLGSIWCEIGVDLKKLNAGVKSAKLILAEANTTASSFGAKLTAQSTRLLAVGGVMAGAVAGVGIASIKMAKDFEVSMRNVNSIAKLSEQEFAKMSGEVLTLSTRLPQSAKVLADGLYDISSSGFAGADGLKVLEASAKAASAGMTNTATSAKGITAVLNAYGLEAKDAAKISDTMFKTVDKGVITFEELSSNIGEVVGTANLADIEFNELSGALAYMTTKGIGAAESTTSLNRLILSIIDPSEELAVVLHNAGYESGEMALQQLGLVGVMELMQEASNGSLTELQKMTPEMRAMKAAGALLGGGIDELNTYMNEFKDTTGATDAALKEQSKSLEYNIQILKNNIGAIGISLGTELIPPITDAITKITEWISKNQELAGNIVKVGGGIIGFAGIVTMLAGVIGKLRGAMITLRTTIITLNTSLSTFAITGSHLAVVLSDIATGLSMFSAQIPVIGAFIEDMGLLVSTTGELNTIVNNMKMERFKNYFWIPGKEGAEANEKIVELITSIQNFAVELSTASPEIQARAMELNEAFNKTPKTVQDFKNLRDGLAKLTKEQNNTTESSGKYKIIIEEQIEALEKQGYTTEKATEIAYQNAEAMGYVADETDETTESIEKQADEVDKLRQEFSDLIDRIFGITNAENDLQEAEWALEEAQKAVIEATKEHGEGSKEAEQAINDYEDELQNNIIILHELYTEEGISIERKEELKQKLFELLKQAKETSNISQEKFIEMATQFGLSADEIMVMIEELGYELTELEKERVIKIKAETEQAERELRGVKALLDQIQSKNVTITTSYAYSTVKPYIGGIITSSGLKMASGGFIGYDTPMLKAASGYTIPQTGREVPIIAHEGEVILNTSQQKNLAEAIWGVANGKTVERGISIDTFNVITPKGSPSEIARETVMQLRLLGMEAQLR